MNQENQTPIAIVGMGCRFPGGSDSIASFWDLLKTGQDAIIDIPEDRWSLRKYYHPNPDTPGKMYVRQGGFLQSSIYDFDPGFFGISPREAMRLDPQQRMLLEVTWETIENAGLTPTHLANANTGVYVGAFTMDNMGQQLGVHNRRLITSHTAVSTSMTMLANRLSYVFNLKGPSLAIDTACSSSLVAVHLGCQGLQMGECDVALVGGVNVMFRPEFVITMCKGRFLSPDARCKAFDISANGYVRGEGAGMIALKRLDDAIAAGDQIHAVIRASGVNQDGRSDGVTIPSRSSQENLIRRVLAKAEVDPREISYVEAHGTGTQVGDPIEANALGSAISEGRDANDLCWIGSVKTNIGHLEAAAGVAGVIKTVLALKEQLIPPHLHLNEVNPAINLDQLQLKIPQKLEGWNTDGRAIAGVNSFGYGGTNAHVIIQGYQPAEPAAPAEPPASIVLPLSVHQPDLMPELIDRHTTQLKATPESALRDYLYTATLRRTHQPYRLAVTAGSQPELIEKLENLNSASTPQIAKEGGLVFVYTGMGPQWWGMGRDLMANEPDFAAAVQECDQHYTEFSGRSLLALFDPQSDVGKAMIEPIDAQPANLALQIGLTRLWQSRGVVPQAIVGHSVGEIAAAWAAGSISLRQAVYLAHHRSRLMQRTHGQGGMLVIGAPLARAEQLVEPHASKISIAAVNSIKSTVLSGDRQALSAISEELDGQSIFNRFLPVEVAYHSWMMEPFQEEFLEAMADFKSQTPQIDLYSTVTGSQIKSGQQDGAYWWRNARQAVQFGSAVANLIDDGFLHFIEIGPHPALGPSISDQLHHHDQKGTTIFSLRRQLPAQETIQQALTHLFTVGAPINWSAVYSTGQLANVPGTIWQKERYWVENTVSQQDRVESPDYLLLQDKLNLPQPVWTTDLSVFELDYLQEHAVKSQSIFPAAGYIEIGLAAARQLYSSGGNAVQPLALEKINFTTSLPIKYAPSLHIDVNSRTQDLSIYSNSDPATHKDWQPHASMRLLDRPRPALSGQINIDTWKANATSEITAEEFYAAVAEYGFDYGPIFRPIRTILIGDQGVLARLSLDPSISSTAAYIAHPALLDGCLQSSFACMSEQLSSDAIYLPTGIEEVRLHRPIGREVWCTAQLRNSTDSITTVDITVYDNDGRVLIELMNLSFTRISTAGSASDSAAEVDWEYELIWEYDPTESDAHIDVEEWWVIASQSELDSDLVASLSDATDRPINVLPLDFEVDALPMPSTASLGVVLVCPPEPIDETGEYISNQLLNLITHLQTLAEHPSCKLFAITQGLHTVLPTDAAGHPHLMTLWGLARVVHHEFAERQMGLVELSMRLIDIPASGASSVGSAHITAELLRHSAEYEVALRADGRFIRRMVSPETREILEEFEPAPDAPLEVEIKQLGVLDSMRYRQIERQPPGANEVEIRVMASALNFKDVMKAMNLLNDAYLDGTFYGTSLGLECSGTVVSVGENVTQFQVGDDVVTFSPTGSFKSYVTAPTNVTVHKPKALSFEESVVFINFGTAYVGLIEAGRLTAGERVLIHSATGGVGLAAVQIAKKAGAIVYATAGTPEKRAYLRQIGVEYVSDSRSLAFADDVMEWSQSEGVDVVLNTLSGEGLVKSLELLAPYGRFIEIGKRDITEKKTISMAMLDHNIVFSAIDLDQMLVDRPTRFTDVVDSLRKRFDAGEYRPLPIKTFAADHINEAFRLMMQAGHIGKIVVNMSHITQTAVREKSKIQINPDATYLITGGFGGFGLEVSRRLVAEGAKHLAILSRSGASRPTAQQAMQEFEEQGVSVYAVAVNVADRSQMTAQLADLKAKAPPLRGVVHSAMLLDDASIIDLNASRMNTVMAPKAFGAWLLHELTQDQDLDFFVLFSSISAIIGNPRQGNYAAANAYLDGLARYRAQLGQTATTINWGSIGEVGAVARHPKVAKYLASLGVLPMDPHIALDYLVDIVEQQPTQAIVVNMDWNNWANSTMPVTLSPVYDRFRINTAEVGGSGRRQTLIDTWLGVTAEKRLAMVTQFLVEQLAKVTRLPVDRIDPDRGLDQLGIDSLMVIELNNLIRSELDFDFSVSKLAEGLTLSELAKDMESKIVAYE